MSEETTKTRCLLVPPFRSRARVRVCRRYPRVGVGQRNDVIGSSRDKMSPPGTFIFYFLYA